MDRHIGKELDKRYNEHKADPGNKRSKAVIDLVLQSYMLGNAAANKPEKFDPEFRAFAIRQIRLFLFAGNDSTSITICYSLHLLSKSPDCLACLRAEHDQVFGSDVSAAPNMLKEHPHLANSLPYTTAVLKEALRLFVPAGTSRAGKPNQSVTDDQGNILPTDETMLCIIHVEMHQPSKYWKRPEELLPEHWLAEPAHELYPTKGAWRPFEHGPRNCIAQGHVMSWLRCGSSWPALCASSTSGPHTKSGIGCIRVKA